jgi:hypothetical protein
MSFSLFAQKENNTWVFSSFVGITFQSGFPRPIKVPPSTTHGDYSCISNRITGEYLFHSQNGGIITIDDKYHPASMRLNPSRHGKGILIVPDPSHEDRYYSFGIDDEDYRGQGNQNLLSNTDSLYYQQINTVKGNINVQRKQFLKDSIITGITATRDADGNGYWLITHHRHRKIIYAFHITAKGIEKPIISEYEKGKIEPFFSGSLKASPDGKKICLTGYVVNTTLGVNLRNGIARLFSFDNKTGKITYNHYVQPVQYDKVFLYSSFSPDNSKLYMTSYVMGANDIALQRVIEQYDLSLIDTSAIQASRYEVSYQNEIYQDLQLGPDGKLYVCYQYGYERLGVIDNPNIRGKGCGFKPDGVKLRKGVVTDDEFPNMLDCFFVDEWNYSVCRGSKISVGVKPETGLTYSWSPTTGIDNPKNATVTIQPNETTEYTLTATEEDGTIMTRKFLIRVQDSLESSVNIDTAIICDNQPIQLRAAGGTKYQWTPTAGLDNATIPNPLALPKNNTRYRVIVSNNDCKDTNYVMIIVGQKPIVTINRDTIICFGNSVPLQAGGGTKYEWFPKSGLNNYFIANPIAMPSTTTRYKVIISNATCADSAFVTITIKENEKADAGRDKELCAGLSVRLGTNNNPQVEYSWSPADYLDNPKSGNPLCTPEKNIQYILKVKNSNGCENYDTVNVTLGGELSVFAGADTSVCTGEQIQLNASGAENFSWSPADGLSNATIANPIFTGTSTTQYIVTGKSGNCEGKDTILVTVNEKPIIIASENREICVGDTVHLSAKGALEYSWSPAEGLNNATIPNPIFNGTKTTEYIVTGKNGNCSDSKKVIITVNEKPTISVSENRELCAGDTVHLSAKGALEYSWSPAEGLNNPTIANPIFIGTKTTEYIVTGKTGNCFDSKKILITVNEKPTISVSENREICLGDTVHLRANNADNYLWTPSTYLNNATIANPIAQPTENITYTVRGTNTNGCYEEKTISITINNDQEKTISLQLSDTAQYAPGTIVPVKIIIPAGLAQTTVTLNYDPCCVRCDSIFTPNAGISTVFLRNNALRFTSISPNKQEKEIILPCTIYLPPDGRKSEKFTLSDIIHSEQCLIVRGNNDEILYDLSCAWQFRGVQQTGRFGIESDGIIARLYTGYGGAITVKIFDLTGVEVWHYSSLYNSTDMQEISLPSLSSGMYIMQASNGVWHDECVMMK